jgi:hypothetical protein
MIKTKNWDALIKQAENELERLKLEREIARLDEKLAVLKPFLRPQSPPSQ